MRSPASYLKNRVTRKALERLLETGRPLRLHIGCGAFLLPEWVNFDQAPRAGALFLDAREPLPIPNASASHIFHEHFLEHLDLREGAAFLRECARVLAPGGLMRVSTPDLELTVATYLDRNPAVSRAEALSRHARITHAREPITPAMLFNDKMRLWGHRFLYDEETLSRALTQAGLVGLVRCRFGESEHPALAGLERHADVPWMRDAEPLILEARKPG